MGATNISARDTSDLFNQLAATGLGNISFPIIAALELYEQGQRSVLEQRLRPLAREANIQDFRVNEVEGHNPWSMTIAGTKK